MSAERAARGRDPQVVLLTAGKVMDMNMRELKDACFKAYFGGKTLVAIGQRFNVPYPALKAWADDGQWEIRKLTLKAAEVADIRGEITLQSTFRDMLKFQTKLVYAIGDKIDEDLEMGRLGVCRAQELAKTLHYLQRSMKEVKKVLDK